MRIYPLLTVFALLSGGSNLFAHGGGGGGGGHGGGGGGGHPGGGHMGGHPGGVNHPGYYNGHYYGYGHPYPYNRYYNGYFGFGFYGGYYPWGYGYGYWPGYGVGVYNTTGFAPAPYSTRVNAAPPPTPVSPGAEEPLPGGPEKGLKITKLDPDGPAAKSSLRVGDIILGIGENRTERFVDFRSLLSAINGEVDMVFINVENGKLEKLPVKVVKGKIGATVEETPLPAAPKGAAVDEPPLALPLLPDEPAPELPSKP